MSYTKQQLRDLIYARIIDNVTEEISPEDLRQVLDALTDAIFEMQATAGSDFYFGPWVAQPFSKDSIAISASGTKLWKALQNFNSGTEPTANNAYWKLVAEFAPGTLVAQVNQLNQELAALSDRVTEIDGKYVRYVAGKLIDPAGNVVQVGSDFYFGPWKVQTFKKGWIAISTDKKKQWQAQGEFSSLAEPTAEGTDWKLLFEDNGLKSQDQTKLDKFGEDTTQNLTYSGVKVLRTGDAPSISAADLEAMTVGETNIFTVQKQSNGTAKYGAGVGQIDAIAPPTLGILLGDDKAWAGQQITLNGTNTAGQLGYNAQDFVWKRRRYLCITHTDSSATWVRGALIDTLDQADVYDQSIIGQLETEAGWSNNIKQTAIKSVKGDDYTSELSGYYYVCFSDDNKWRRVSEPATEVRMLTKTGSYVNLCTALEAHDFGGAVYNAAGLAAADWKGIDGQMYYVEASRALFSCVKSTSGQYLWEKIK